MRYISGWVESKVLCLFGRGLFIFGGKYEMKRAGFYLIKDAFFEDMEEPFLKGNKSANRPHYYCIPEADTNIYWMIPLSSRVEKYKNIMLKLQRAKKSCNALHIALLGNDKESVFLIQDIFPVTEKYIEREYTIGGIHFILRNEQEIKTIENKSKVVIKMLKQGIKFTPTQPNVLAMLEKLKDK